MLIMELPRVMDLSAARPLWLELERRRGEPLALDASKVERLGALGLQALIAAAGAWRGAGQEFRIVGASGPFLDALRTLGADGTLPLEAA
jgi:chemotaxis protein CheX